jgi:hypothetical protein
VGIQDLTPELAEAMRRKEAEEAAARAYRE